ncbi:tumor necrosis factor ligand superfamily member 6 isoform X1 [Sebastes umbrosus]|uniref:tumor necrosis factor ligand superfamily member 6 isoform X1 n=1 Tax=Sebastes umbrosus TaxID=72105 RepID=UPI00189D97BF|nr:tumor necrosis factor ligand superfamily member 6 isoform X1 [Sebastes umbrosus]
MSRDQRYPFPQVFPVDGGRGPQRSGAQPPNLVPCWSFPPAQERAKSRGCMGVSYGGALVVLMLFLLMFAALGFEAYQINNMQEELRQMQKVSSVTEFNTPQMQIDERRVELKRKDIRPAAHVMGRIEKKKFPQTLRWEPKAGRAFVSGGVAYSYEDGALQINETGLYHIYSRVELIFKDCSPTSSFTHSVFVRRAGRHTDMNLMQAHRAGFCSQQRGHAWTTESYLASALQLQKADSVFVNVSHPVYLTHEHYANFFGLYKI